MEFALCLYSDSIVTYPMHYYFTRFSSVCDPYEFTTDIIAHSIQYTSKSYCHYWLQTTIDFQIHLSYKTGHFGGLYKIP